MARREPMTQKLLLEGDRQARTVHLWTSSQGWAAQGAYLGNKENVFHLSVTRNSMAVDLRDGEPPVPVQNSTPKSYPVVNLGDFGVRGVEIDRRLMVNGTGESFLYQTTEGNFIIVPHGLPELINVRSLPMQQDGVVFIASQEFRDKAWDAGRMDVVSPYMGSDLDKCPLLDSRSRMPVVTRGFVGV